MCKYLPQILLYICLLFSLSLHFGKGLPHQLICKLATILFISKTSIKSEYNKYSIRYNGHKTRFEWKRKIPYAHLVYQKKKFVGADTS